MIKLKPGDYMPSIRWRQGEYQALLELSDEAKAHSVPLITIPHIEYDFEEERPKNTVNDHVKPFPKRYKDKWGTRPAWIDIDPSLHKDTMATGDDVVSYVFDGLRKFNAVAVPVVALATDAATKAKIAKVVATDKRGIGLRARFEDIMRPTFTQSVRDLMKDFGLTADSVDLLLDLGAPTYDPYETFSGALIAALKKIADLPNFRNFVLFGTAIPESFADITKEGANLPRHEWLFYKEFVSLLPDGVRRPNYGDCTIVHPSSDLSLDFRKVKAPGKVIYTTPSNYAVYKGGAFRGNEVQMHDHCAKVTKNPNFQGEEFSYGDKYISLCAIKKEKPSTLTRWKTVGINHHIAQVLDDLATLTAAA